MPSDLTYEPTLSSAYEITTLMSGFDYFCVILKELSSWQT